MNNRFCVIWNKARKLVTGHASNVINCNPTQALVEVLEAQEEESLVWVMQLHSLPVSCRRTQRNMIERSTL
ncbi:hypothetical protein [Pseudomonas sp. NFX98]|uniref:hypothetical protein n=1 Tax=Pseudomonas sp. NFX98 TaxID=3399122 RepID=UPI0039FC613C